MTFVYLNTKLKLKQWKIWYVQSGRCFDSGTSLQLMLVSLLKHGFGYDNFHLRTFHSVFSFLGESRCNLFWSTSTLTSSGKWVIFSMNFEEDVLDNAFTMFILLLESLSPCGISRKVFNF